MKRILSLVLTLLLACAALPALAEDVLTIQDATQSGAYTSDRDYLRILCPLNGECQVTVTVAQGSGSVIYQRDYGLCSDAFRSEDIYLPFQGQDTLYNVSVAAGEQLYGFSVTRVMPRLRDNAACSVGYPLSSLTGSGSWKTVTFIDVAALEGSSMTVPLHASGAYTLGSVTFSVSGGALTVSAQVDGGIDGSIDKSRISVAATALEAQTLGTRKFQGLTGRLDESIALDGSPYAAVYVDLTVSFDPSGVPASPDSILDGQEDIWQLMQQTTANEAVG